MKPSYLLDTDVLVDFFRGVRHAVDFVKQNSNRIVLSVIVLSELYAGVRDEDEVAELDAFFQLFPVYSISPEIARTGGLLKWQYSKSHGLGLADALLAATVKNHGFELKTLNIKHYPMFSDLQPPYRK